MNSEETKKKGRSRRRFLQESVALAGLAVGVAQAARGETAPAAAVTVLCSMVPRILIVSSSGVMPSGPVPKSWR